MPNQKNFDQLLIFVNLYQHAKNEAASSICSGEMVDLKILQSEWLRVFWPTSQDVDHSQRNCAGTQQIIKIFIKEPIQGKLIAKLSLNSKNLILTYFWPISPIFRSKKKFPNNSGFVTHHLLKVSSTMSKFRET